jgi:hypothetical protein
MQSRTTNYGLAGGTCDASVHVRQHLEQIERELAELLERDPTMYFMGDFDALLDRHHALTESLKGPIS